MDEIVFDKKFFKNKKIFITGHTGFKGSWLCKILLLLGAEITGYSIGFKTNPNLFNLIISNNEINSKEADIRDLSTLKKAIKEANPDLVIHMAAQPIVRESYINPVYTYEVNVMGTVNILEAIRSCDNVGSFLNVTTDKVYQNNEWVWGYRENDVLNGFDPYSNSKSCSELVTDSYKKSFLNKDSLAISTARSGNVIGGGDFSADRIIPDCFRSAVNNEKIIIRNPEAVRPYQHVIEPLFAYLTILKKQYSDKNYEGSYNIGPDAGDSATNKKLVSLFCETWGNNLTWEHKKCDGPHEANLLRLDCSKFNHTFNWKSVWTYQKAIVETANWYKSYAEGNDIKIYTEQQIINYMSKII